MAIDISYNGNSIASLNGGETAIIKCAGKKMKSDLTVVAPESSGETIEEYDGTVNITEPEIEPEPENLMSFTIDGIECQAVDGMTWAEWCASEYNDVSATNSGGTSNVMSMGNFLARSDGTYVIGNEFIISGESYQFL